MQRAVQVASGSLWCDIPAYVAMFSVRVDAIASANGWTASDYEEDGVGTQRGLLLRLPSGVPLILSESARLLETGAHQGACCEVPLEVFRARGAVNLLAEILPALGLSPDQVAHRSNET